MKQFPLEAQLQSNHEGVIDWAYNYIVKIYDGCKGTDRDD